MQKKLQCKKIDTPSGKMLIVELLIDVGDAMGANVTNTMCEAVSPLIEKLLVAKLYSEFLSNYSTRRIAKAKAVFEKEAVGGDEVVDNIILAFEFADNDVYRAVTHNKGIMNGIIAVANATGQDSRAIEAAANAYAAKTGQYRSLSKWSKNKMEILLEYWKFHYLWALLVELQMFIPVAKNLFKILGVSSAQELACIMTATGLAQNYSAIEGTCNRRNSERSHETTC